jgi:predicted ATPase
MFLGGGKGKLLADSERGCLVVRDESAIGDEAASVDRGARIVTPDQRLRVFVSSTLRELAGERAAAGEAIAALRLTPVLFELGARPHPPRALYRAYVEQSQLFVGLYWQSYGWVGPGESISGIEDEYRLSDGLPRLLYVKEPAPEREPRLRELLEEIKAEGLVSYKPFGTAAELGELLARDLALVLTERFQETAARVELLLPPARLLPAPRTSFVGRESELTQIEELLTGGTRLLTLTGPGGIGKTRLAVEAARRVGGQYADGVAFVPLEGVESAELVPAAIAEALGVSDPGNAVAALVGYLRRRRMLLVLDNFEHLITAAPIVAALLEDARELAVLVTSRELLRISGEYELQVTPLSPDDEAIALFAERAVASRHGFELTAEDLPTVKEICRRLDGVPLAIELAAPRMRLLTPRQLLERLSMRLELRGPRDAPARHRTLEAAIAWSYELLAEEERLLFERLGVFHGSFSIDAAEEVASLPNEFDLLDVFSSLLDKSIVYRLPHLGETRFAMLRMIREYALERLTGVGDREATAERLQAYYLRLVREAEEGLRSTAQRQWRRTLDLEADNIRAALISAADHGRGGEIAALIRGLYIWFWLHGNLDEVREWAGRGLSCADGIDGRDRGWLLALDGTFAVLEGRVAVAADELAEAEALLAQVGDRRAVATVRLAQSFGSAPLDGESQLAEALAAFEELDDLWGVGTTLHAMCRLRIVQGRYEEAGDLFEQALASVETVGDELGVALALNNLAMARFMKSDIAGARAAIGRALEHRRAEGITFGGDEVLDILARVEHAEGEHERAVALLAAAEALRERLHTPLWAPDLERHERLLAELRAAVGDEAFQAAYTRGATLDVDDLQEVALRLAGAAEQSPTM